ncbi:oxidoreductase [Xylaria palmicola]|nr:oxidoreductase [Xylaria palmicola]
MVHLRILLGAALTALSNASSLTTVPQYIKDSGLPRLSWKLLSTGSKAQFRGLAPVSDKVAWVSGTNGTVLRTTNGGESWTPVGPSLSLEDAGLEFRDIEAWSVHKAVILSIGEGTDSRIYSTKDGGATWTRSFTNREATAFYDCVAFENPRHGMAMSDPVDGKFRLIETFDGGETWDIVDPAGMAPALDGEAGFAASGTCLETAAGRWYIASGGIDPGRIFRSVDGHRWEVSNSSIAGGAAGGVFSVRFRDARHGIAVGGDFQAPGGAVNNAAWSQDGGKTWIRATSFPDGYRSGSSWVQGLLHTAIAVGPTGSDFTVDGGRTWHGFDNGTFDSVECLRGAVCWASGQGGRVARLSLRGNERSM